MTRPSDLGEELLLAALVAALLVPLAFLRAPDVVLLLSDGAAIGQPVDLPIPVEKPNAN